MSFAFNLTDKNNFILRQQNNNIFALQTNPLFEVRPFLERENRLRLYVLPFYLPEENGVCKGIDFREPSNSMNFRKSLIEHLEKIKRRTGEEDKRFRVLRDREASDDVIISLASFII